MRTRTLERPIKATDTPADWALARGYEPCTPPSQWHWVPLRMEPKERRRRLRQYFTRQVITFKAPIPTFVWERIREALPIFGPKNLRIYAPDPELFGTVVPLRDPMLIACWGDRYFRLAVWGLAQELRNKTEEERHAVPD